MFGEDGVEGWADFVDVAVSGGWDDFLEGSGGEWRGVGLDKL